MRKFVFVYVGVLISALIASTESANAHSPWPVQAEIHGKGRALWQAKGAKARNAKRLDGKREDRDVLTQELAEKRATQVESVDYSLNFAFTKKARGYRARVNLFLKLKRMDEPLSIDALLTRIESVKVNGEPVTDYVKREGSFDLPAHRLAPEMNVEVEFYNDYNRYGQGLIRFTDPVDGTEYIYTDLEPYGAHTFFPCLDQPDLKATYQVTMNLPDGWRGINNMPPEAGSAETDRVLGFQRTVRFSTYLLFVGAGDYHVARDEWHGLPLAIYSRQSLARHVDHDRIFKTTKDGLDFFTKYFDYPYPFPKYDHIFAPDLGPGAMENPGAVTMNERMIYRGPQSYGTYMGRANTILHEMAHHWFGDLVTMKWWDDLWLNEAFATYMASLALASTHEFGADAWVEYSGTKGWAYWQDQLSTTHPIVGPVPDTDASGTIFDGITYGKGSAVLKQLHFAVGEEAFRTGVREYFRDFAWGNAVRADFVGAVARAANTDLEPWSKGWLESQGVNRIRPEWSCANGAIANFAILQDPTSAGLYLEHRTRIGLFHKGVASVAASVKRDLTYAGPRTEVRELVGEPCPDFVFANSDDHDYALALLDSVSLEFVKGALEMFAEPLVRNQLWIVLHQMVKDRTLRANEYLRVAARAVPADSNEIVVESLIGRYSNVRDVYWGPLTRADRDALAPILEAGVLAKLEHHPPDHSEYLTWLDHFIGLAHSAEAQAKLIALLNGAEIDQDRRWAIVVKLAFLDYPTAESLIAAELERDASDFGKKQAYAARVAIPDLARKRAYWRELTDPATPLGMRRAAAAQFHNANHPEISREFVEPFFAMVRSMDFSGEMWVVSALIGNLFPAAACDRATLEKSRTELAALPNLPFIAKRAWIEANDGLEQCVLMREANARAR